MKKTLLLLAAFTSVVSAQSIVNVTNLAGGQEIAILDNAGELLMSGATVAAGLFAPGSGGDLSDPSTFGSFTFFGQRAFEPTVTPGGPANGFFNLAIEGPTLAVGQEGEGFIGQNISVILFGGSEFTNATEFISFDTNGVFLADSVNNAASSSSVTADNLEFGTPSTGEFVIDNGFLPDTTVEDAVSFAQIPEPSSTLLAGLALIGGLVRRRR